MSNEYGDVVASAVKNQKHATDLIEKLFDIARPGAVYGEPVASGEYTVITASEVSVAMGSGYGIGGGSDLSDAGAAVGDGDSQDQSSSIGAGGGGGGGGVSGSRPVAVISVGPNGVRVEPVVDITKLGLALLTALGSMYFMLSKMRRAGRR